MCIPSPACFYITHLPPQAQGSESLMRLSQTRKGPFLSRRPGTCAGATECGGPGSCRLLSQRLGRGRKWSQRPRYLGDAGNRGLAGRMAHSGGGKGHGAKFTRGQASLLAQERCTLQSSGEKNGTPRWESLAGRHHVQLGASPGTEEDTFACPGGVCAPAGWGRCAPRCSVYEAAPQFPPPGDSAPL